ncbi:MAG: hypothetical protein ACFB0E_11570 [Leptolyngbyaceae cyanobacterium]
MSTLPPQDDAVRDYWIKQSELLQNAINRMANNSLEVKKFGVAVWTAITGFGVTNDNDGFFVLAFAAVIVFAILDLYYLFLERKFRDNYNRLVRLISGYGKPADHQWVMDVQGNFMKPDRADSFLGVLFNPQKFKLNPTRSWANLPYLIMVAVTIWLFFADFSTPSAVQ